MMNNGTPHAISIAPELREGDGVMGVDEAGRGPLAGGVFAAAVYVPLKDAAELLVGKWAAVNDSKKLSPKKREALAQVIRAQPCCVWAVAEATPAEIDEINILQATHRAMRRAVKDVLDRMPADARPCAKVLVDGLRVDGFGIPSNNLIKGDAQSLLIAAASILAKTARDADCMRLDALYPQYGFAKHKGYPTAAHYQALMKYGPCPEHRRSFTLERNS